jgi:hypothetical protein
MVCHLGETVGQTDAAADFVHVASIILGVLILFILPEVLQSMYFTCRDGGMQVALSGY